jgi:hypothetical protein
MNYIDEVHSKLKISADGKQVTVKTSVKMARNYGEIGLVINYKIKNLR